MFWLADIFNGSYSQQEVHRIETWARRQRAEAVQGLFSALGRGLVQAVRAAGRGAKGAYAILAGVREKLAEWNRKQATIRELNDLSDRTLKDIGLHRGEIRAAVEAMLNGERQTPASVRSVTVERVGDNAQAGSSPHEQETGNEWQRAA